MRQFCGIRLSNCVAATNERIQAAVSEAKAMTEKLFRKQHFCDFDDIINVNSGI